MSKSECYFLDFYEHLLSFTCILACTSTISVFVTISLLSHAWNCFARTVTDSATRFTHMHVVLFSIYFVHSCHAWSSTSSYTQYRHALTFTFSFNCPSKGPSSLGPNSTSPRQHCVILRGKLFLPLRKCAFLLRSYSPCPRCTIFMDSDYWPRKLRNATTEPTAISSWNCALHNSSNLDCTLHNSSSEQPTWIA